MFDRAVTRPPGERTAWLDHACGADQSLRAEVESLLAANLDASGFLETPPSELAAIVGAPHRSTDVPHPRHRPADPDPALPARLQAALGGTYRIEGELGGGGMSRVFVAEDASLHRRVAIKVLPPNLGAALDKARFQQEVLLVAHLRHPHIVPLLTAGESADGLVYFTMPFVEGESLKHRLAHEGALALDDVVHIVDEVADALAYAHRHGVVHRDVKPGNVLVDEGHVLVTDFGIAKALSESQDGHGGPGGARADGTNGPAGLTSPGLTVGTPAYMSPEQAAGDGPVDGRSDVYSLGCMTYEMLTGARPFASRSVEEAARRLTARPPSVAARRPDLPAAVDAVVARALAPRAADRYQTPLEFAHALATAVGRRRRQALSLRRLASLLAAVAAIAVGGVLVRERGHAVGERVGGRPMVVVLPFQNVGKPGDEYLADGITDGIRSRLAGVSGIGVIARASAAQYKHTTKSVRQIGHELAVDYVLDGTIRWDRASSGTSRVRVTPELVRASDAAAVWAGTYDAPVAAVFEVQTVVAEQVARALDVTVLAGERRAVAARPTRSIEAYDAYLRGIGLTTRPMSFVPQARRDAVRMFERAVELDPRFAAAWARLSLAHGQLYTYRDDPAPSRLQLARAAALRALALDSSLPAANLALAKLMDDPAKAVERCAIALRTRSDNVELLYLLGTEQRRLGRYEEALTSFTHATVLDPRSPDGPAEIANLFDERGDYGAAVLMREREIVLTPDNTVAYVAQALSFLNWRGDTAAARHTLERAIAAAGCARLVQVLATRPGVLVHRVLWPLLDAETRRALDTITVGAAQGAPWRVYRLKAEHLEWSGQPRRARTYHDSARITLEARLRDQPNDPELHGELGLAYAALGRSADAVREGRRGVALAAAARNTEEGPTLRFTLAMIYVRVGEHDAAIEQLASGLPTSAPAVSPYWLRLDATWAPLRDDPRFVRLSTPRGASR